MKKCRIILFAAVISALVCANLSAKTTEKKAAKPSRPELTDWKGKKEGNEIPRWVKDISLGEYKSANRDLGISDDSKSFFVITKKEKLKDALLLAKIDGFCEIISTIERTVAKSIPPESVQKTSWRSDVSYREINYSDNGTTGHAECYSPFGYSEITMIGDKIEEKVITEKVVIPDWVEPSDWKKRYDWFKNPNNLRIDQFWIEQKMPTGEIQYQVFEVMSMAKSDFERFLAESFKKNQ